MKLDRIYGKHRRWHLSLWQLWSAAERKRQSCPFCWFHLSVGAHGSSASLHLSVLGCGLYLSTYSVKRLPR